MASDTFKSFVIGLIVISLFAFMLIIFASQLGTDYGRDISELEGSSLNLSGLNSTLQSAQGTAETWMDIFSSGNIFSIVAGIVTEGIFKLTVTMFKVIMTPFAFFMQMMTDVLHIPPVVVGILIFSFIVTIIFAMWRLLKQGD